MLYDHWEIADQEMSRTDDNQFLFPIGTLESVSIPSSRICSTSLDHICTAEVFSWTRPLSSAEGGDQNSCVGVVVPVEGEGQQGSVGSMIQRSNSPDRLVELFSRK